MNDNVDIFVKNMDLTDDLREYIDKKIPRLERYLDQIDETRIDLAYVKNTREADCRFVAQITLREARLLSCERKSARWISSRPLIWSWIRSNARSSAIKGRNTTTGHRHLR